MTYTEEVRDLFSVSDEYVLAHCISADFALGAGIAVKFREMGVKRELERKCGKNLWRGEGFMLPINVGRIVCNLVTKEKCWYKPTYDTLRESLEALKIYMQMFTPSKLAMPLIGCGLDGLEWDRVSTIIKDVFKDTDTEILICKLK